MNREVIFATNGLRHELEHAEFDSANSSIGVLIYNSFTNKTFANMLMICVRICDCFNF